METINNVTSSVKTAIWGEGENTNNTGTTGTTGNTGTSGTTTSGSGHTETHRSMIDDSVTESKPYSGKYESDPMAEDSYNADRDRDKVPQGPQSTGGAPQGANITGDNDSNQNSMSNSNEPNTGFGGAGAQPSVGADPASGQKPREKHQGSDKPNEDPDDNDTGSGSAGGPTGASGGPGANAGNAGPGGMKLPDEKKSTEEGTGTKYEKSTGLHADGGDFDATRPGAAREADRLMEEKGIKHGDGPGVSGEPEKKEKKWYGVDHSGFGGHGSHSNQGAGSDRKGSSANADDLPGSDRKQSTTGTNTTGTSATGTSTTHTSTTNTATNDETDLEKKGLAQKVKDKLHV